jgi:hypothetical protein
VKTLREYLLAALLVAPALWFMWHITAFDLPQLAASYEVVVEIGDMQGASREGEMVAPASELALLPFQWSGTTTGTVAGVVVILAIAVGIFFLERSKSLRKYRIRRALLVAVVMWVHLHLAITHFCITRAYRDVNAALARHAGRDEYIELPDGSGVIAVPPEGTPVRLPDGPTSNTGPGPSATGRRRIRTPGATVTPGTEADTIEVGGDIGSPGTVSIAPGTSILLEDLIRRTGGIRQVAPDMSVVITRGTNSTTHSLRDDQNRIRVPEIYVANGDRVHVRCVNPTR